MSRKRNEGGGKVSYVQTGEVLRKAREASLLCSVQPNRADHQRENWSLLLSLL